MDALKRKVYLGVHEIRDLDRSATKVYGINWLAPAPQREWNILVRRMKHYLDQVNTEGKGPKTADKLCRMTAEVEETLSSMERIVKEERARRDAARRRIDDNKLKLD
ncbi:hypothetical protein LTR27_000446 [Elasticomyces elasticus]|nr:hypothetical protein LTR27_000446 [Elasticomyces elasticus]